jgi:mandelamide amidase
LGDFLTWNASSVTLDQVVAGVAAKDVQALVQAIINNPIPAAEAEQAARTRLQLALEFEAAFGSYDISALVYPTVPVLPPAIRPQGDGPTDTVNLNGVQAPEFNTLLRNTCLSGVVGTPSLVLPGGLSSTGLPVGISLEGLSDGDSALLGIGLSVEAALGRVPGPVLKTAA